MIKKIAILALACVGLTGCVPHFKELDSYNTNFRNDEISSMPGKGDPYTFGGMAEGSGGNSTRQSYATDNNADDPRDPTASLGEIAKDRTRTPGGLPGVTGTLPGTTSQPGPVTNGGPVLQVTLRDAKTGKGATPPDQKPAPTTGGKAPGG